MQNAMSFMCPIRRVQLYADPDFSTEWGFSQEDNSEQTLNLETDDTARPRKKLKTEAAPPVPGEVKELKDTDLTKPKEQFTKIGDDVDKFEASVDEANGLLFTDYIPAKVIAKMNDKRTELLKQKTELQQILDSGKSHYSAGALKKMIGDIKKQAKEEHNDADSRLKTAKSDMAD